MLIGELAVATGTTTKTRFYEQVALLPAPQRTPGGYRNYPREAVTRLHFIRRSRAAGLSLAQIRDVLDVRDTGTAPCHHVQQLLSTRLADLDEQIAHLQALRETVAGLREAATTVDPGTCDGAMVCRYL